MKLSINGKERTIEFTFEAAESELLQTVFDYFSGAYMFKGIRDSGSELEQKVAQMDAMISGISAVPKMAIDLFYIGLLEHHGPCGDTTQDILSRDDAKMLYKAFCKENPENEISTQSGLFEALKKQMEEDGFFKRIGLEQMKPEEQPQPKISQEYKKKSTEVSNK